VPADAGDRVLIDVANVLRASVRATDIVDRIGGDEYAAVLAGQSAPDAERLQSRMQLALTSLSGTGRATARSGGL